MVITNIKNNFLSTSGGNLTGNLTVLNKNVVRTVNSTSADTSGNLNLTINADSVNSIVIPGHLASIVKTGGSGNYEARTPSFGSTWFCVGNVIVNNEVQVSVNKIVNSNSVICDISSVLGNITNQIICIRIS